MEAILYRQSGRTAKVEPPNGEYFTLNELQLLVGGYIEIVQLSKDEVMVIQEDGKLCQDAEINHSATRIAREHQAIWAHDCIVGNALVCPSKMVR
jgi:hypothetical protein BACCOPRO_02116|nr:MAG TPA: protein of unknown function (DUF3846) [Caudoviricetes sp.]